MQTKYWITQSKIVLRNVAHNYIICKCPFCKIYHNTETPPLPTNLVLFQYSINMPGVGCLGPAYVKDIYVKSARAIHLELVVGSTGHNFINALKSFIDIRSIRQKVISDDIMSYVSHVNIDQMFNAPVVL